MERNRRTINCAAPGSGDATRPCNEARVSLYNYVYFSETRQLDGAFWHKLEASLAQERLGLHWDGESDNFVEADHWQRDRQLRLQAWRRRWRYGARQ